MELLSPAGHWEAMVAAVQNGADAVYMGLGDFNARRGARNFSEEEYLAAVSYCHLRGAKVYLTLNTLLGDRELKGAEELLRKASRWGVDGVIVQDWGVAQLARQIVPDLPLHGSTQMSIHNLDGVLEAAKLGMQCVVLSRELSKENIRYICERSPIKIEAFAHGALCMCYSGQCAMSALIGQRSGNRGTCAQPCRLPYKLDGGKQGYPLSLKDANLASHLQELRDMGVSILKLEGRMKRPEYVAVITRIYAQLLKEGRMPRKDELKQLEQAFSRSGFTEGYWEDKKGPHMFGTRAENTPEPTELFKAAKAAYDKENLRTVPISLTAEVKTGREITLTATDFDGHSVTAIGSVPEAARTRAITAEELRERLGKTGGTAFRAEEITATVDEGLSLPASAVNALRRDALEQLAAVRSAPPQRREFPTKPIEKTPNTAKDIRFTVSLHQGSQLSRELMELAPAIVYLPAERIREFTIAPWLDSGTEFCVTIPRIWRDGEADALRALLENAKAMGCRSAAAGNLGHLAMARELGFAVRGDYGLNVFNSRSLGELADWGLESAAVSFELRHEQVRDLIKPLPCEAIVYGRLPLMVMENCIIANGLGCKPKNLRGTCRTVHTLTDRKGESFPVLSVFGCRNEIENAKTLFLADKPEYRRCGLTYGRLRFTTEGAETCVAVLKRYLGMSDFVPEDYTRGLFYRGVE